jgi:hypothetical protein
MKIGIVRVLDQSAVLKKLEPIHNKGIRLGLGIFAVLAETRNLNTAITALRIISNPTHPIRPFCVDTRKIDEYVCNQTTNLHNLFSYERWNTSQATNRHEKNHHNIIDHHGQK